MAYTIVLHLAETSLVFSALFTVTWLIKALLKKQLSTRVHYVLWGIVILKLLIPFSFSTGWSLNTPVLQAPPAEAAARIETNTENAAQNPAVPVSDAVTPETSIQTGTDATPMSATRLPSFDWMTPLVWVWLGGIFAGLLLSCYKMIRLKKAINRCAVMQTPDWMQEVFCECKSRVGIQRYVCVVVQGAVQVPAAMGILRPMVIVPEWYAKQGGKAQMECVFMHELAHIKRQDIAVIWCLNILRAIYWFNPLVWLCFREVQKDMEADCDRMTADLLGSDQLRGYVNTILQFSGKSDYARMQAAMSLNDGCMKVEQRIRRIYKRTRTKGRVKIAVLALALLMTFAAFTTGCRVTQTLSDVNLAGLYKPAGEWKMNDITQGDVTIHVDAQVFMPDTDEHPIYAYERGYITKDQIDSVVKYFFHRVTEPYESELSEDGTHYANYGVRGDIGRDEDAALFVHNEGTPSYLQEGTFDMQDVKPYLQLDYKDLNLIDGRSEELKTTSEQAIEIAQNMLDACGFAFDAVFADEGVVVESGTEDEPTDGKPGGYAVHCLKRVNSFYLTDLITDPDTSTNPADDGCVVYVDDQGIFKVELDCYGNPGDLLSKDTDILSIEEIEPNLAWEIARQYDRPTDRKLDITIKKAMLGLATFPSEEPGQWQLQPVWTFYGWVETDEYSFEARTWMLFSLDATDGQNVMFGSRTE